MSRLPFASGLPGNLAAPVVLAPDVAARLHAMRAWAQALVEETRPRAVARFDGCERIPAEPQAVDTLQHAEFLISMLDRALRDPELARRISG